MPNTPVVGDRYYFSWAELGRPTVPGTIELPGLGKLLFDDADAFFAGKYGEGAGYFVRRSRPLGEKMFVVVSREQRA